MGCDIHMYVECKPKRSNYWRGFGGRINPGRIYGMFAKLADVRNSFGITPLSEPRGVPDDIGSDAFTDYSMYVTDTDGDRYVTKERAQKWVDGGSSVWLRGENHFISAPDWHSGSWCTSKELEDCINEIWKDRFNGNEVEWVAVVDLMKSFERQGWETRCVFWFDN